MHVRKGIIAVLLVATFGGGLVFVVRQYGERLNEDKVFEPAIALPVVVEKHIIADEPSVVIEKMPDARGAVEPKSWSQVFFTSQAPMGEWMKSEFQNGCEEASALMVYAWRSGKTYTKEEVRQELIAMARYQEKKIGQGVDTDVETTATILLKGYFDISDYRTAYDFTLDELKSTLAGGLVIVPTNGQALSNPNFTRPGPLQHMLVVTGYDAVTKEFITNDPGTRKGASYRYPEAVLYAAIREYPTGKHLPIETERKAMIVISSPVS